ncbi:hypothetical protein [Flagellimonas sp. 2504JD4-2]
MSRLKYSSLIYCIVTVIIHGCKIADLRTAEIDSTSPNREERAVALLDNVISKYNLDKLVKAENYSLTATDNWRGLYALVNPFPKDNELMELRFRPKSFDGQFNYLETNNANIYGVQSFNCYNIKRDGEIKFKNKKRIAFTLPAIQYFFELPLRLRDAPILKYAGSQEFENKTYDLVFATWDRLEPHKEHDQYLLYFDKETGDLCFASYTVRGIYLPAPKNTFGSIRFSGLRKNQDGILYPNKLFIQLNKLKKERRTLHTITINDLRLNSFELLRLYPDSTIAFKGDAKF